MKGEYIMLIPPIKCQGIKTKIVPYIKENVKNKINTNSFWIEPFLGSGVVAFNIAPKNAILSDKNKYIISFYKEIQNGKITPEVVRKFLEFHGKKLSLIGESYYKEMRKKLYETDDPLIFLFLNRSDFNGMIRFNKKGEFNVPFCKKVNRFSKSYVTKICNQVSAVAEIMKGKNWTFICGDWREVLKNTSSNDFVYLDPPYIGRDTSYVGEWPLEEAEELANVAHNIDANVCLSMWKENEFRTNEHLIKCWNDFTLVEISHFYHIGAKENNRHPMIEVLAFKRF